MKDKILQQLKDPKAFLDVMDQDNYDEWWKAWRELEAEGKIAITYKKGKTGIAYWQVV